MSYRSRALPWWEDCGTLGHVIEVEGACNPEDPDGSFFCRCSYCTAAAKRKKRLAQTRIVYVLDAWLNVRRDQAFEFWLMAAPAGVYFSNGNIRWREPDLERLRG